MLHNVASASRTLSPAVRAAAKFAAVANLLIGLALLLGPELGISVWPTPLAPLVSRFAGSVILGDAVGAWLIARQGTWEGARALFAVALVYGVVFLLALLYHLVIQGAAPIFWAYVAVDAVFLAPVAYICWSYERATAILRQEGAAA